MTEERPPAATATQREANPPPPARPHATGELLTYATPAPRRYHFSKWVLLPLLLLVFVQLFYHAPLVRYGNGTTPAPISTVLKECVGFTWGAIFFSLLLAVAAYFVSGRKSWVANGTFAAMVLVGTAGVAVIAYSTGTLVAGKVLRARLTGFNAAMAQARATQDELADAGSFGAVNLDEPGQLERRRELANRARAAMAEVLAQGDAPQRELDRAGVMWLVRRDAMRDWEGATGWSRERPVSLAGERLYAAGADFLAYLASAEGEWSVRPGVNVVDFQTAEAKARADELIAAMQQATADVQTAQNAIAQPQGLPQ